MVAAPLLDSSSGCACTAISRSGAAPLPPSVHGAAVSVWAAKANPLGVNAGSQAGGHAESREQRPGLAPTCGEVTRNHQCHAVIAGLLPRQLIGPAFRA